MMSWSKNIESVLGIDNLEHLTVIAFESITVEPIPTVKEYGEKMPEEDRLSFAKAVMRSIVYHKVRGRH